MLQLKNAPALFCLLGLISNCFWVQQTLAQEKVVPLQNNLELQKAQEQRSGEATRKKRKKADTLSLPFFDDFSYEGPYPDEDMWMDKKVYVNTQMAVEPTTYGVATFDGLNEHGRPYNPDRDNNNRTLPTDTLTSNYIDLSGEADTSDIYLSFFYQPKGLMDAPERIDSLLVQIRSGTDTVTPWRTIWRVGGGKNYNPVPDFKPVILPIDYPDSLGFYHEGFQFRFLSFGNVSGNLDNWHVDYVQLGANRNPGDTTVSDVAITTPPLGILKDYREIPWSQFDESYLRDNISITARNMSDGRLAVECGYSIVDLVEEKEVAENFSERFADNIDGGYGTYTYEQANLFDRLDFPNRDSVLINLTAGIFELGDDFRRNDTFRKELFFQHYFAYDDGTAEGGYGIESFFQSGKVAQRYSINNRDTLRAVGIKFNQSEGGVSDESFDLKVWANLGPLNEQHDREEVLATRTGLTPKYNGRGRDGFVIYELDEPVEVGGIFYLGWEQYKEYNLNVGLDKRYGRHSGTNGERKIFYNYDGIWQKSSLEQTDGAVLMIRPFVGKDSINFYSKITQTSESKSEKGFQVKAYPNPVKNRLHIKFKAPLSTRTHPEVKVFNFSGKLVKEKQLTGKSGQLNVKSLTPGMYLLKVRAPKTGKVVHKKVIKE